MAHDKWRCDARGPRPGHAPSFPTRPGLGRAAGGQKGLMCLPRANININIPMPGACTCICMLRSSI